MKVIRHGKPSNAYLSTLERPKKHDWNLLVRSCVEAIVQGEEDVIIAFSYVLKFPKGFPRGILEEKVDDKNIHRIKARKLLTWLNEKGHTDITVEDLRVQCGLITKLSKKFEISVDEDQHLVDNVKHQLDEQND